MDLLFLINSVLLGAALAMDAFSVSLVDGLHESRMRLSRQCKVAGVFGFFQTLMPMLGWFCVRVLLSLFHQLQPYLPWIACALLSFLGIRMIMEGIKGNPEEEAVSHATLFMQGIATSIDALSVGFTIGTYPFLQALVCVLIIGTVTFIICLIGLQIGRKAGEHLADRATVVGGVILIVIGVEILLKSIL
ncbi:MAG: manganese efflux pump [Solobacterium sp.]|nr:manganese efflux pump [Solobacterium sp.]